MRSDWDDELSILSAENVNFALETAGLGSRFAAAMIDMTLQALTLILLLIVALYFVSYFVIDISNWSRWTLSIGAAIGLLILFLILYGYYFFFEWLWDGQTPGKRWLGLRVLQTSGMPITAWSAMARNLFRIIDFMPVFYGVGAVVAWTNPHNRRIGDLIAGTVVARERREGKRAPVLDITAATDALLGKGSTPTPADQPGSATAESTPSPDVMPSHIDSAEPAVDAGVVAILARLNQQDYELVQEFLTRRNSLTTTVRARLAQSLAARLSAKLGEPMPEAVEPFLEAVADALQRSRPTA